MKIDPTKWPKVEKDCFPADGMYWHVYTDGDVAIYVHEKTERVDRGSGNIKVTHYGPIEFDAPKPRVIPPKPDAEIVAAEFPDEGNCVKWCLRRGDRLFPINELNWKVGYVEPFCKIIET